MMATPEPPKMEYMIRFLQVHETFRLAEIQALATLEGINLEIVSYNIDSPCCFVRLESEDAARRLVARSILCKAIYEVWGTGSSYADLHDNVKSHSQHLWPLYKNASFKFYVDTYQGTRGITEQNKIIEEFKYMGFEGKVRMKGADQAFWITEEFQFDAAALGIYEPQSVHLGRFVGGSDRTTVGKYDLKKRRYISTTSMDSELALVTANISLAASGKLFYDPFCGTGSFPIACAHFGAQVWGSDIDGRSVRGKGDRNIVSNFVQYDLMSRLGDNFISDLTNTPLRATRLFDGIVCDPPYGVREGLKVLGSRDPRKGKEAVFYNGDLAHKREGYIPPKRPYGFLAMLDDILDFSALSLVENGRLSFWMPTSNDEDQAIAPPTHPCLAVVSLCTQDFNKWSRRLITYRRLPDSEVVGERTRQAVVAGRTADDLNPFRKRYFDGYFSKD